MKSFILFMLGLTHGILAYSQNFANEETVQLKGVPPKVLIFYSSVGMGHLSAAKAIADQVKSRDPRASVVLKDIRDFMPKWYERLQQKAYWYLAKKHPDIFDRLFRSYMSLGNAVNSLSHISMEYNQNDALAFTLAQNPTAILATHYGAAQVLGNIRERGHLKNVPIGWLHTDYFTGYFPRISKRIESTFVGMRTMEQEWITAGVDGERVKNTGIPINEYALERITPEKREEVLRGINFDPAVKTVVLASGGEGVGNFPLIVEKLAADVEGPLQIIAVCAKNEKHFEKLTKLKPKLRSGVHLRIEKFVDNKVLLDYIKSSDVYITKSGGLSPTEGFAITKPIVLLDVYGGHERDNAKLFEKEGLAVVCRDQKEIGKQVNQLLADVDTREAMLSAQLEFRNSLNFKAIGDFIFNPTPMVQPNFRLGVEMGNEVEMTEEALAQLEADSPADVEIILSYGKSLDGRYIWRGNDSNPFGHLAIRIKDKVYTVNGRAILGQENNLLHETTLREYLFGVKRPYQNVEHTDAFGSSYGRDNISIRVRGLTDEAIKSMFREARKIDERWREGQVCYNRSEHNCADFVVDILRAGGLDPSKLLDKKITFPLDVFEAYRRYFEKRLDVHVETVAYSRVPDSQSPYKSTRFPLSFYQVRRSLKNLIFRNVDPIETQVEKRIAFYPGDNRAHYENINGKSVARIDSEVAAAREAELAKLKALEKKVEDLNRELLNHNQLASQVQKSAEKILSALTPEMQVLFLRGNEVMIQDRVLLARLAALRNQIKEWDKVYSSYEKIYDQLVVAELDYLMGGILIALHDSHQLLQERRDKIPKKKVEKLEELYAKALAQNEKYVANKSEYGKPHDGPLRTDPYRAFFYTAKQYFDLVEDTNKSVKHRGLSLWDRFREKAATYYNYTRDVLTFVPEAFSLIADVWFVSGRERSEKPITHQIHKMFRNLATKLNISVFVEGRENLPRVGRIESKHVYIVAPTHRHPILDAIAMSHLGIDKALLVLATDQFASGKLAERMVNLDSLVTVGRGRDKPILKILEQFKRDFSNTILIYPEGSVSAGIKETRPVREKFGWGLIHRLQDEGYKVTLVPVTYEDTGQFLDKNTIEGTIADLAEKKLPSRLHVRVHKPIDDLTLRALRRYSSDTAVNRFLRHIWMENLQTDKEHLNGMIKIDAASRMIIDTIRDKRIFPNAKAVCEALIIEKAS